MKEHRSNRSYYSRLTRLVDRGLPFNFEIEHLAGVRMGLADYISREINTAQYNKHIIVAKLDVMKRATKCFLLNDFNFERNKGVAKRFLLNKPNFERNAEQLQSSCQSHNQARKNELITTHITPPAEHFFALQKIRALKQILQIPPLKRIIQAKPLIPPIRQLQISLTLNHLISNK